MQLLLSSRSTPHDCYMASNTRSFFGASHSGSAKRRRRNRQVTHPVSPGTSITPTGDLRAMNSAQQESTPSATLRSGIQRRQLCYQPGMALADHPIPLANFNISDNSESDTDPATRLLLLSKELVQMSVTRDKLTHHTPLNTSPNPYHHRSPNNNVLAMLQQQQAMLTQILQKQDSMDMRQLSFEKQLEEIESKLPTSPTSSLMARGSK